MSRPPNPKPRLPKSRLKGQFEIVYRSRSIERQRGNPTILHSLNQKRSQPHFQHVRAAHDNHRKAPLHAIRPDRRQLFQFHAFNCRGSPERNSSQDAPGLTGEA